MFTKSVHAFTLSALASLLVTQASFATTTSLNEAQTVEALGMAASLIGCDGPTGFMAPHGSPDGGDPYPESTEQPVTYSADHDLACDNLSAIDNQSFVFATGDVLKIITVTDRNNRNFVMIAQSRSNNRYALAFSSFVSSPAARNSTLVAYSLRASNVTTPGNDRTVALTIKTSADYPGQGLIQDFFAADLGVAADGDLTGSNRVRSLSELAQGNAGCQALEDRAISQDPVSQISLRDFTQACLR